MITEQLLLLVAWMSVAGAIFGAIFWVVPTLIRLRFVLRAERLRDEAMDLVLAGELPLTAPVEGFLLVQDGFITHSRHLTFGRIVLTMASLQAIDSLDPTPKPSFATLTPPQRKKMNELERRSKQNLYRFIGSSGPMAWAMWLLDLPNRWRKKRPSERVDPEKISARANNEMWALFGGTTPRRRRDRIGSGHHHRGILASL